MATLNSLGYGVGHLDAHYIQNDVASIYFIHQGNKVCLIETGSIHSLPHVEEALSELNLTFHDVDYIIPTHIHLDHAGGAGHLMQKCSNATLVVHPRGAAHMAHPEKLEAGTKAVYGDEKFAALYGSLQPIEEDRIIAAEDNFSLDFNGRTLKFIDTPGHALHHFCIYDELSNGVFTGDTFGVAYKTLKHNDQEFIFAATTPSQFDPDAMVNSIDRIMSLNPDTLYLTHFGAIKPTETLVKQLKHTLAAFVEIAINHQDTRENRVPSIKEDIINFLLNEIKPHQLPLSMEAITKLISIDCELNAQGLDVWLQRLEKKK